MLWGSKVTGDPIGAISGLRERKNHLDVGFVVSHRVYYKGGRWWLPPSPGRGESSMSMLLMARPSTKGAPITH